MKKFVLGIRDKTALCFTWLLIIWTVFYWVSKKLDISLQTILQLLIISFFMALIFNLVFATNYFKKLNFTLKLSIFIFACTLIESLLIYYFGLFGISTISQWAVFFAVIICLYSGCIGIFQIYKVRARREYTRLLKKHQETNTR